MKFNFNTDFDQDTLDKISKDLPIIDFQSTSRFHDSAIDLLQDNRNLIALWEADLGDVSIDYNSTDVERLETVRNALDQEAGEFRSMDLLHPTYPDVGLLRREGYDIQDDGMHYEDAVSDALEQAGVIPVDEPGQLEEYLDLVERNEPIVCLAADIDHEHDSNDIIYLRGDDLYIQTAGNNFDHIRDYRNSVEGSLRDEENLDLEHTTRFLDNWYRLTES